MFERSFRSKIDKEETRNSARRRIRYPFYKNWIIWISEYNLNNGGYNLITNIRITAI